MAALEEVFHVTLYDEIGNLSYLAQEAIVKGEVRQDDEGQQRPRG